MKSPFTSIADDLFARGLLTSAGTPWSASSVAKLVSKPGYCGLREHKGGIVGPTSYPALIGEPLWRAANGEIVTRPGSNARRHLLSGIARCEQCGSAMVGSVARNAYRCSTGQGGCGRTRVKIAWLDDPIVSLILARETARSATSQPASTSTDLGPALAEIDAEIRQARALFKAGDLVLADYTFATRTLRDRRAKVEQAAAASVVASVGSLVSARQWIGLYLSARRALIGRHVDTVLVGFRTTTGPGRFEPRRYVVRWTDGTTQRVTQADLDAIPRHDSERGSWSAGLSMTLPGLDPR